MKTNKKNKTLYYSTHSFDAIVNEKDSQKLKHKNLYKVKGDVSYIYSYATKEWHAFSNVASNTNWKFYYKLSESQVFEILL